MVGFVSYAAKLDSAKTAERYWRRTEHDAAIPENKCYKEPHDRNVSPYLFCNPERITDNCNGDADDAMKHVYT